MTFSQPAQQTPVVFESTAEVFEDELSQIPSPGPNDPQVLFRSSLVLTREREDLLCQYAKRWYDRLNEQLGREDTSMETGVNGMGAFFGTLAGNVERRGERRFFEKRLLYQLIGENNFDHRKYLHPNSIFAHSNLVAPVARRIATQQAARAISYFFGTDPWFSQYPVGGDGDKAFAQQLQKLTETKFRASRSTDALRRAVEHSFIVGEAIMKTTFAHDQEFYRETLVCAVGPDGLPLIASDEEPITPTDTFSMLEDPAQPGTGAMVFVLDRDKQTPVPNPEALNFQEVSLDRQVTHYKGPRTTQVHWRDFLCPLNAPSVQEAECVIQVIERTPSQIVQTYVQAEAGAEGLEEMQRAVAAVRDGMAGTEVYKTGDRSARPELGETTDAESPESISEYAECYLRYDADGDLVQEDIMLVINLRTGFPIFYDYVANVTDNKLRPFTVIRPKAVINRWYGQGAIEQFELHQETVDLMLNRRNFNQSGSGRVILWRPEFTYEGQNDPELAYNWGKTYHPLPGKNMDEILKVVYIEDNKGDDLTREIEFFLQLAMNESGIQHANDGNTAGADSTKLATGIHNIEKSGQELFGVVIAELDGGQNWGITGVINSFTTCLYNNLDPEEVFEYFEGDAVVEMQVPEAKGLSMNVETLLTRYRDEQILESSTQAVMLVEKYYSMPGPLQVLLAGMFRDQLQALQIPRASDYIIPQAGPMLAPQATPAPGGVVNPPKQGTPLI